MSDDIVQRLRAAGHNALMDEAADEIAEGHRQIDVAWAAGLFEGEGATCCAQKYKAALNQDGDRRKSGFRWWLVLHSTDHDVLRKFHSVVDAGKLFGPYSDRRNAEYKPQLRWATTTLDDAQKVLRLFIPYLGERRKAKALQCLEATYVRARSADAA